MAPSVKIEYNICLDTELPEEIKKIAIEQGECDLTRTQAIAEFRNYILEQNECNPPRMDDEFLLKFLRNRYWRVANAHTLLVNYCKFRDDNKSYHEKVKPMDLACLGETDVITVTPYRDQAGRRILIHRFGVWKPGEIHIDDIFRATIILQELGSLEPIGQVVGGVAIFDMKDLGLKHIMQMTPTVAQKILALLVTSMPIRTAELHIVNQNWAFSAAFNFFTPFLSASMKEKLFLHGSDMSSLHKHILPEHLPKRYGGVHDDYPSSVWLDNLSGNRRVEKELETLGYVFS